MGRELSDSQLRRLRIKRQSQNPFGANFSTEVRSPRNLRLVSNSKDNELHHNRIVDVFEPFFVRNDAENLATVDHLAQRGIYIGNNDKNLTAIPSTDHQTGDNSIHRFAIENNIQANLFGDTYNGFDPRHGMPFNMMKGQIGVVGRDAGHFIGHASRPDLSNDPYNIGYQNQYENKGQAAAEKIASQQGRVATGTEIADMLWKSIVNRTVEDVKLPRRNSAAFKSLMGPINAKVDQSRMAGQIFIV